MTQLSFTMRRAKDAGACAEGYAIVEAALGSGWDENTPVPLLFVLDYGRGLTDTLWALRCTLLEQDDLKRRIVNLWLADVLEHIQGKMTDPRSRAVITLLREHAATPVSLERWRHARHAAYDAALATDAHATAAAYAHAATAYAGAAFDAAAFAADASAHAADASAERDWQAKRLRYWLEKETVSEV